MLPPKKNIKQSPPSFQPSATTLITNSLLVLIILFFLSGCASRTEEKNPAIFYPEPPQQPRLQFLTSISSEEDLESSQRSSFDDFLLGPDLSFASIGRPYDIGSSRGKLYILDRQVNKILIIDLVNQTFEGLKDRGDGALHAPAGFTISPDDLKYVSDMKRKQVVAFDAKNDFVRAFGDEGLFQKPVDVAIYKNRLYVCDMLKNQIVVLDMDSGAPLLYIGETGSEEGQLYKPSHITVDTQGNLYVNDAFNFRVQQFDVNGNFVQTFGFHGDQMGGMARTKGLDIDHQGNLYVADAASEYVQIFNKKAQLLLFMGGPGLNPGNMYLPAGVHIDYENIDFFNRFAHKDFKLKYLLYVCNMSGPRKINVYGFGDWSGK